MYCVSFYFNINNIFSSEQDFIIGKVHINVQKILVISFSCNKMLFSKKI